jgi:TetR/AcrR family transcriptional regulator, fatty acid metabolism regulator protein
MSPRPRIDRATKRAAVADAAAKVFAQQGVSGTAVSDIARAAGIAQGTFYLYFESKDDVLLAVAEQFVASLGGTLESSLPGAEASAPERLRSLVQALVSLAATPANAAMAELLHRPENRALHDRLTEPLARRMFVLVEGIVGQGVAEGSMQVDDPGTAAWFVLSGMQGVERAGTPVAGMPAALDHALVLALRALGVRGEP